MYAVSTKFPPSVWAITCKYYRLVARGGGGGQGVYFWVEKELRRAHYNYKLIKITFDFGMTLSDGFL